MKCLRFKARGTAKACLFVQGIKKCIKKQTPWGGGGEGAITGVGGAGISGCREGAGRRGAVGARLGVCRPGRWHSRGALAGELACLGHSR